MVEQDRIEIVNDKVEEAKKNFWLEKKKVKNWKNPNILCSVCKSKEQQKKKSEEREKNTLVWQNEFPLCL